MKSIYVESFNLPTVEKESSIILSSQEFKRTCYNNFYPFRTLPEYLRRLDFSHITILYGGNGSGKTTILNLLAEKIGIKRSIKINKSSFFDEYLDACYYNLKEKPLISKIITSDDVFSNLFITREKNEVIDKKREEIIELRNLYNSPGVTIKDIMDELVGEGANWIDNIDTLEFVTSARGKTGSMVAKNRVEKNIIGKSNGETAIDYFLTNVNEPGLYLLDEPENSLSASYQRELSQYLFDSARFFGAQLIIATHSPFILSIPGAKIYNLDSEELSVTDDWTTLDNMKEYYALFKQYSKRFE